MELKAGDELSGHLTVESTLGVGGMGVVYRVRHPKSSQPWAVKVLNPELLKERDFVRRFKHEAKIAARLKHANVVFVHSLKRWQGTFFYTMELVDGKSLDAVARENGEAFTLRRKLVIVREIAAALGYIHSKKYVHRDVKPANVLVRADDHIKVTDFGLAQKFGRVNLTRSGHVMGSAKYMAPELILAQRVTPQTDIYSLGVTLYELLAGACPFDASDTEEIMDMHLYNRHKPLVEAVSGTDPNLSRFVDKMLRKDVSRRVSSAAAAVSWIDFYLQNGWFADVRTNI